MGDSQKSRRFKDLKIGDLFTFTGIIYTKIKPGRADDGSYYNAISDTRTGSKRVYFTPYTVVEKLDE